MGQPPESEHVVIVGGAIIGSFVAWSLRGQGFVGSITVVEKDPTYQLSSTALSAAAIRTQFGTPMNIAMSLYSVDFFRTITDYFGPDADIGYVEHGYLILGRKGEEAARAGAAEMQNAHGADIAVLNPDDLAAQFPYMDFEGVGIGTFGRSGEGWFDAWSLLTLVRKAARDVNVTYLHNEVTSFAIEDGRIARVGLADGSTLRCDHCVLAAGPGSGRVAALAGIDLPVTPRKRTVFHFDSPLEAANFPFLSDPSGIWVKPEGTHFIGGVQPAPADDHDAFDDFVPHHDLMEDVFWPALVNRIPVMDQLRLRNSWAGHYEVNTLDHNSVVGRHDEIANLIFATGFSGHGVMHAAPTGRAVAELITTGSFQTIDMSPLSWERVRDGEPMSESIII